MESLKIETCFFAKFWNGQKWPKMAKNGQIPKGRFWPANETHILKVWFCRHSTLRQFWKAFFVGSLLEATCAWNPMGQREVSKMFERVTFLVYGYPTNDKRTFHFLAWKMTGPWVVSLQEVFWLEIWPFEGSTKKFQKMQKIHSFSKKL